MHVGYGDFTQIEKIRHEGMLVIGTYDKFTCGNPEDFLENINKHFCKKKRINFYRKNWSHIPTKRARNCRNNFKIFARYAQIIFS